jgi:hypothetical protein
MAEDIKPFNIGDWPREGLTLEDAIERAIGPLKPVYAAHTALQDLLEGRVRRSDFVLPRFQADFERERRAIIDPFRELLASGELVIAVRPFYDIDARYHRLHSDEARELYILVAKNSLHLSLGKTKLHAVIWANDVAAPPVDLRAKGTELPSSVETMAATSAKPVAQSDARKVALKTLLKDVIEEIQFPGPEDRWHGWKRKWAAEATHVINERHRQDPKKVKRTKPRSVENRMNEFGLWPD